jgi:hypothetical protein
MENVKTIKNSYMKIATTDETKAFLYKLIGDLYRYLTECAAPENLEEVKLGALENYKKADETSKSLNACNPIRLGLALNFSLFYYEVMNKHKEACKIGENALAEALK